MVSSSQVSPGMVLSIEGKLFRVESAVKVTVKKGNPFIKTKLCNIATEKTVEKNFKLDQTVDEVSLQERPLEFLYLEGKDFLFLDTDSLDQVLVPVGVVGDRVNYLKEGTKVAASFYGETVFAVELPQFLELMVSKTDGDEESSPLANTSRYAILETGARLEVPPYIEVGDVIKVDTKTEEYIQRV